jgi:periplasmic protein TonB
MNRYFSSFFITTILYLVGTIFLFYTFADILIVEEKKQEELKISLNHVMIQPEQTSAQAVSEPIIKPEPLVEVPAPIKKKIEKPKKENIEHKKIEKEPIIEKVQNFSEPKQNTLIEEKQLKSKPQIDEKKEYLDKNLVLIRSLINENVKYPTKAKKLSIEGIVVVKFRILEDGSVQNIQIIEGQTLLRNSTIEAIEEASKNFPKSEISIEIQIPIEYKLI